MTTAEILKSIADVLQSDVEIHEGEVEEIVVVSPNFQKTEVANLLREICKDATVRQLQGIANFVEEIKAHNIFNTLMDIIEEKGGKIEPEDLRTHYPKK